jgi:hypothetical protein
VVKIIRKKASEHPDYGKTVMTPIAKLPKRKTPHPPHQGQEPGKK